MPDVFISYSRQNIDFARKLVEALKAQGRESWIDWDSIPLSADWWAEIKRGIDGSDTFLVILSPDSLSSPVCTLEIAHALSTNKRIVPIIYEQPDISAAFGKIAAIKPTGFLAEILKGGDPLLIARANWGKLEGINWIFFREQDDFDTSLNNLIKTVETDLDRARLHTRLLNRALEWEARRRDSSYLLVGTELRDASSWLKVYGELEPAATDLHREFIHASEDAETLQRVADEATVREVANLRRVRTWLIVSAIILIVVAGFALLQINSAVQREVQSNTRVADVGTQAAATLTPAFVTLAAVNDEMATATVAQGNALNDAAAAQDRAVAIGLTLTPVQGTIQAGELQIVAAAVQLATAGAQATLAGTLVSAAQLQVATARAQATQVGTLVGNAQTQVAVVQQLTNIPPTLTPIAATLQAGSAQLQTAIVAQQDAIDNAATAEGNVAVANGLVDFASTRLAQANATLTPVPQTLTPVAVTLAAASTQLSGVQPTLNSAATQIAGVQPTLDAGGTQVAGVQPTLDAAQAQLDVAATQVGNSETQIAVQQKLTAIPPTLTPLAGTVQAANQALLELAGTLTPVPQTLTPVALTLEYAGGQIVEAQTQVGAANVVANIAQTQAANSQMTLTPVPQTLTPAALTLQAAGDLVSNAQQQIDAFGQTLTPLPATLTPVALTLAYSDVQIAQAQADVLRANGLADAAQTQAADAGTHVVEANLQVTAANAQVLAANATLTPIPQTLTPIGATLAAANTEVAGVAPTVAAAQTRVAGVQPTLDGASTQIAGVAPTLDRAATQIAAVEPTLTGVALEIEQQSSIANALRLAVNGEQIVDAGNPDLGMSLILEAFKLNTTLPQVQRVLNSVRPLSVRMNFTIPRVPTGSRFSPQTFHIVAYSPDSQYIAVPGGTGNQRTVALWTLATRNVYRSWDLPSEVTTLTFDKTGTRLAVGMSNGTVKVLEVDTGFEHSTLSQGRGVTSLAFSPDTTQHLIAVGLSSRLAYVANYDTGDILYRRDDFSTDVDAVTFNENGTLAYFFDLNAPTDPHTDIVNLLTGNIRPQRDQVFRGLSPDGYYAVANGQGDNFLSLWDPIQFQQLRRFQLGSFQVEYIQQAAFSQDRRTMIVHIETRTYRDTTRNIYTVTGRRLEYWNIEDGSRLVTFDVPEDNPRNWDVSAMDISPDGRYGITGGYYGTINAASLWDLRTGKEIRRLAGHNTRIVAAGFSPDSSSVYTMSSDGVRVWDIGDAATESIGVIHPSVSEIDGIAFNPNGVEMNVAYDGRAIGRWNIENGALNINSRISTSSQTALAYSPVDPLALVGSVDGTVLWDLSTGQFRSRLDEVNARVQGAVFSPDGHFIYLGTGSRITQWDVAEGHVGFSMGAISGIRHLGADANNQVVLAANDSRIQLYDVVDRRELTEYTGFDGIVNDIDLSAGGDVVVAAIGEPDDVVMIWDARTGEQRFKLYGHTDSVTAVALSPDGRLLVSGGEDDTVIVWDVTTGQTVNTFKGHTAPIRQIAFSPDGRTIATTSDAVEDGILFWRVETVQDTVDWIYANRYVPPLSCEQRQQFNVTPLCVDGVAPSPTPTFTPIATTTLTPTNTPRPTPTITPTPYPEGRVISDTNAILRSGAGSGFRQIGTVAPRTTVQILESRDDIGWLFVRTPNGQEGWISAQLVSRR